MINTQTEGAARKIFWSAIIAASSIIRITVSASSFDDSYPLKLAAGATISGIPIAAPMTTSGISQLYWNPATLKTIPNGSALIFKSQLPRHQVFQSVEFSQDLGHFGSLGTSIQRLSASALKRASTQQDQMKPHFTPNDLAVALGYAYPLGSPTSESGSFAVAGKWMRSQMKSTGESFSGDFGFVSPSVATTNTLLKMAFVIQNAGEKNPFSGDTDLFPTNAKLGSSLCINRNWILAVDGNMSRDNGAYVGAGTQYQLNMNPDWDLIGRVGFNTKTFENPGGSAGFSGLSTGIGMKFHSLIADYAFIPEGSMGSSHMVSLSFAFNTATN